MKTCWNRGSLGDLSPPQPPHSLPDGCHTGDLRIRPDMSVAMRTARAGQSRLPAPPREHGLRNAGLAPGPRGAVAPGASRGAQLHRSNQLRTAPRSTEASPGVAGD